MQEIIATKNKNGGYTLTDGKIVEHSTDTETQILNNILNFGKERKGSKPLHKYIVRDDWCGKHARLEKFLDGYTEYHRRKGITSREQLTGR